MMLQYNVYITVTIYLYTTRYFYISYKIYKRNMEVMAVKPCKYCKKTGKFYPELRKVLCKEHAECQNQIRSLWSAIASMQLDMPRNY
jgi:hypothetical protein